MPKRNREGDQQAKENDAERARDDVQQQTGTSGRLDEVVEQGSRRCDANDPKDEQQDGRGRIHPLTFSLRLPRSCTPIRYRLQRPIRKRHFCAAVLAFVSRDMAEKERQNVAWGRLNRSGVRLPGYGGNRTPE